MLCNVCEIPYIISVINYISWYTSLSFFTFELSETKNAVCHVTLILCPEDFLLNLSKYLTTENFTISATAQFFNLN